MAVQAAARSAIEPSVNPLSDYRSIGKEWHRARLHPPKRVGLMGAPVTP
jgi:hypothetical protein